MLAEVADNGVAFRFSQRRKSSFTDKLFHLWQYCLPFSHSPEARVWHSVAPQMGRSVAGSAALCIDSSIRSVEVGNSSEERATINPQQRQDRHNGFQQMSRRQYCGFSFSHQPAPVQRSIFSFRSSK